MMTEDLLTFLHESPTAFHAVHNLETIFKSNSFSKLDLSGRWDVKPSSKYFVVNGGSSIIAFITGDSSKNFTFNIAGAHTDSPGIKIKPNAEMLSEGFLQLNTEVYGGPLLYTWFDRPLSIAGRVIRKGRNIMNPDSVLVNIAGPVAVIPSLAIHMNREVNTNGMQVNNQKDLLPIIQSVSKDFEKSNFLYKLISSEAGIPVSEILDFELYLYEHQNRYCQDWTINLYRHQG